MEGPLVSFLLSNISIEVEVKTRKIHTSSNFLKKHYEEEEEFFFSGGGGEFSIPGEIEREAKLNMFWRLVDHRPIMVSVEANCDLSNTHGIHHSLLLRNIPTHFPIKLRARASIKNWKCIPSARSSSTFFSSSPSTE